MTLSAFLSEKTVSVKLNIGNRDDLLSKISSLAADFAGLDSTGKDGIASALKEREELATTALGAGTAIPHCRVPYLEDFITGLVTTKKPMDYGAADGKKVDIFPFVIAPESKPKEHLKILSGMARILRNPDTRKAIRSFNDSEELYNFLSELFEDKQEKKMPHAGSSMKMLHVFVRDEELFNDILQVFASGETAGAMVLETHESTEYLSSMPVFAGFWNSELHTFNRIIISVVQEKLLYQTLRNIEYVSGDFSSTSDVMVTVTDLHHALGSLDQ